MHGPLNVKLEYVDLFYEMVCMMTRWCSIPVILDEIKYDLNLLSSFLRQTA